MKVAHLGINAANAENAAQIAELFHVLFGFEPKYGNSSIFVGDKMIEIVKENGRGTNGHICIAVDDMAKAMDELGKVQKRRAYRHLLQRRNRRFCDPSSEKLTYMRRKS